VATDRGVSSPRCRLYSTKATSGRICPMVHPRHLCRSCAGWGRRGRLSTQTATWRACPGRSHRACASCVVLRQARMFSGRMPWFAGTHRASFAPSVCSNLPHSQVGRRIFSRAYTYEHLTLARIAQIQRSSPQTCIIPLERPPKTPISFQKHRHTWPSAMPSPRNPLLLHRTSKPRNPPLFMSFDNQYRPVTYYN
jgi:hypothetical protein